MDQFSTVAQLRGELKRRGLECGGKKNKLIERLRKDEEQNNRIVTSPAKRFRRNETEEMDMVDEEEESNVDEGAFQIRLAALQERERVVQEREENVRREETNLTQERPATTTITTSTRSSVAPIVNNSAARTSCVYGLQEIIRILPKFDPDNQTSLDACQFVERVGLLKQAYGIEDGILILAVLTRLRGNAKMWADTQRKIHACWDDLACDLMINFPNHRHEADAHIELANMRRNRDEKFVSFYHRMSAVARRAGISEAATIKYIRNGLNDYGIRNVIAGIHFNNCLELYAFLSRYEDNRPIYNDSRRERTHKVMSHTEETATSVNQTNNWRRREVRCYNCDEVGHMADNCPKQQRRMRCHKCQQTGHAARDCRETNQQRAIISQQASKNPFESSRTGSVRQDYQQETKKAMNNTRA